MGSANGSGKPCRGLRASRGECLRPALRSYRSTRVTRSPASTSGTRGRQDQARASETFAYKLNSANDCFLIHTLGCSLSWCANKVTHHLPLLVTGTPYLVARLGEVREPSNVPLRLRRSQIRGAGSAALISASTVGARALPMLGEERKAE